MTIKTKTLLWFLAPFVLIATIAITFYYYYSQNAVKQNVLDKLNLAADTMREHVRLFLQEKEGRTLDFSSDGFIRDCAEELTRREDRIQYHTNLLNTHLLINKKPLDPEIISVFVADVGGKIIGSSEFGLCGKNISGEVYFSETIKNGSYISDLHKSNGFKHNIMESARLLLSKNGQETIGVIVNRYSGIGLREITRGGKLEELKREKLLKGVDDTGELYIVNRDKRMITDSRFLNDVILKQVVDTDGVKGAFDNREGMIGIYDNYRGIRVIGVSKYMEKMDWVVLAEKDVSEAFAPITHLRNYVIVVGAISIVIIVIVASFLATGITMPIKILTEGTRRISSGDLNYKIEVKSRDEIGYLASSFNDMTSKLKESETKLRVYADSLEKMVEEKTMEILKISRAVEQSSSTVMITNAKGTIEYVNPKFTQLTDYSCEEAVGQNVNILKSGKTPPKDYKELWQTILAGNEWRGEFCNKKKNGEFYWEFASISPIKNAEGVITHFIAVKEDITERKKTEKQIKAALKEKEILIREIYHRTKNNMQVVCSLLKLQSQYTKDEQVLKIFKEIGMRIKSMSLVHAKLYQSKDLSSINLKSYIEDLMNDLSIAYQINCNKISLKLFADDILVTIDNAVPCGLIINEIITNSMKYAFPEDRKGEIRIDLCLTGNGEIELRIADNGIGMPKEFDFRNSNSLGLQLVNSLTEHQLEGEMEMYMDKGVEFQLKFKDIDQIKRV